MCDENNVYPVALGKVGCDICTQSPTDKDCINGVAITGSWPMGKKPKTIQLCGDCAFKTAYRLMSEASSVHPLGKVR